MLLEMKRRQRQVRQAVPADMAPGFSSLPLISASGLLFVFNKQLGNVRGYCLCDSLATERRGRWWWWGSPIKMYRVMRGFESNTQICTGADAQVYCMNTDSPTRLMIYTLMSFFEAEM